MGSGSCTKRIVDEHVTEPSQLSSKINIIGLLLLVKTDILDQQYSALRQLTTSLFRLVADHLGREFHFSPDQLSQSFGHWAQRIFRVGLALRTTEMGQQNNSGPFFPEKLDCWQALPDPRIVGDPDPLLDLFGRHIKIDTN